jgi:hypothetical protein
LEDVLAEYGDIFAMDIDDYGRSDRVYHRIDTGEAQPIRQPPRRLPLSKQAYIGEMLKGMQRRVVIEELDSPCSSSVVLVRKRNWDLPFCVDCRKLNEVKRKYGFPLPQINDTLDTLAGGKWFSTLGLKSGYWQVDLHPDDKERQQS